MSYILDALKKAESERERGGVPGLHAQPLAPQRAMPRAAQVHRQRLLLGLGMLALLLALLAYWRWPSPLINPAPGGPRVAVAESTPATPQPQSAGVRAPDVARGQAVVRPLPSPPAGAARLTPGGAEDYSAALPETAPTEVTRAPASQPKQRAADTAVGASPSRPSQTPGATASKPSPAPVPAPRPVPAATPPSAPDIPALEQLSPETRQSLPKLAISGATYSSNPAWRMLIINGQVFHEGERPAADLQLEQIRPKAAVLNYRGQRYLQRY